jgi:hypothetical protein
MLQALILGNRYLCSQALAIRVNRRANDSGIARIDQPLVASDNKRSQPLRISGRIGNEIEFASFHDHFKTEFLPSPYNPLKPRVDQVREDRRHATCRKNPIHRRFENGDSFGARKWPDIPSRYR